MKTSRRKFLKNGLVGAIGAAFLPGAFYESDIQAAPLLELEHKPDPLTWDQDKITLTWVGHSTVLINLFGKWILTDPVLFERVGLYLLGTSFGPSRISPPALNLDELPRPDIILLSHAHMDHTDYPTLKAISERYPGQIEVLAAHLTSDVISDLPWKRIHILDWEESKEIQGIHFKAFEVNHFGWRFPWEKDRSRGYIEDGRSFNAYLIESGNKRIFFGGDTALTDKLKGKIQGKVDIALMPVGAYDPWRKYHCTPEEALEMATHINCEYFIPIHCKTFRQGREPVDEPIARLNKSSDNFNIKIGLDKIGQTFELS